MTRKRRAIFCVTNDLSGDQRVLRHARTLADAGMDVLLIGRMLPENADLDDVPFAARRFRLFFRRGPLFYAAYNLRLFFSLILSRAGVIVANDLDTLPACFLAAKLKGSRLYYDSHEYFTGVPELVRNGFAWTIWKGMEKLILPRLKHMYTVNDSIAGLYREEYGIPVGTVRNIPPARSLAGLKSRAELGLPEGKKIILLQGAWINVDRGGEEAVEAMKYLDGALLLVVGSGDVVPGMKDKVRKENLGEKVMFRDKMPYHELFHVTANADVGLSLDKDTNVNYRFSLPNKLFDYIRARVPVLASPVVEVEKIVAGYGVGEVIESHDARHIAGKLRTMLHDEAKRRLWKANLEKAAQELCWEREREKLLEIFREVI